MDLGKFIELFSAAPAWFKLAVGAWILGGAVLFVRFLTFPYPTKQILSVQAPDQSIAQDRSPTGPQKPPAVEDELTPESYFRKLDELKERFLERDEFIRSNKGRKVKWLGFVDNVSERRAYISLWLKHGHDNKISILVALPLSFKTKAFSLQSGDLVEITGDLDLSSPFLLSVDANELVLVKPRPGKG